jgi:2-succinyl-6-hydroxy-2,4-cyclohexadiene-1-carboxylate synthase
LDKLVALHGFLGKPTDFASLSIPGLLAFPIFRMPPAPLDEYAKRLNPMLRDNSVLLGYSMGGRLALHCLLDQPKKYRAAILLATHPGLKTSKEKFLRLVDDLRWARKFITQPWASLMKEWNERPTLLTSPPLARLEEDFSRLTLSSYLRYFSLGHQQDLIKKIEQLHIPILWLQPSAEAQHLRDMKLCHPCSRIEYIFPASHRFLWESPHRVRAAIGDFLNRLDKNHLATKTTNQRGIFFK